jgi:hypothetical protein
MVDQLQYESPIDLQQLPKLDISGGDPILILRPSTPRWLYLFFLIFSIAQFCAFCVLSLFFIRVLRSFPLPFGRMPRDLKLIFIGQLASIAFWLLESVWFGAWSFRQYQMGLTPRKLWISNGSIHLNRAGNWRVSTKTRDLQSIREIRLKPIKGFIGGTAGAHLIVRFGRFRHWNFRFKQNQMPLAAEAQRQFGQRLELAR